MTNFYCHGQAGDKFDRVGTCTDKTGNDPACPFPFLRSIRPSHPLFVVSRCRIGFAYITATQTRPPGTGLVTMTTLPTAATELFV